MALRRPLKVDSSGNLRVMNSADLQALRYEAIRQYSLRPAIVLQYDSDGTAITSIGTITDTRYQAGATATNISAFPSAAATPDVSTITVTWDKIAETVSVTQAKPIDSADRGYPIYYDGSNIRAMSDSDYIDTFIIPAIDRLTSGSLTESDGGGTYFISTATSDPNGTRINTLPVFTDTRADAAAYTAAGIPEVQDQPITIQNYYLFRLNSPPARTLPRTAIIRSDGQIARESPSRTRQKLAGGILWATRALSGYRLRYDIDSNGGSGINAGTGMVNTRLSGSTYAQRLINVNDYRTQEFPSGTPTTISTSYLKIKKT